MKILNILRRNDLLTLFADLGLGCAKATAALLTPSSALFAEAARSFALAGARLPRLLGCEADSRAGRANAAFVAALMFSASGAMSFVVGLSWLARTVPPHASAAALAVLMLSLAMEVAWRNGPFRRITLPGTAACLAGVAAAAFTGDPLWDALGAIAAATTTMAAALAAGAEIRRLATEGWK